MGIGCSIRMVHFMPHRKANPMTRPISFNMKLQSHTKPRDDFKSNTLSTKSQYYKVTHDHWPHLFTYILIHVDAMHDLFMWCPSWILSHPISWNPLARGIFCWSGRGWIYEGTVVSVERWIFLYWLKHSSHWVFSYSWYCWHWVNRYTIFLFLGDAILVFWRVTGYEQLLSLVHEVIKCSINIQTLYGTYNADGLSTLRVKIGEKFLGTTFNDYVPNPLVIWLPLLVNVTVEHCFFYCANSLKDIHWPQLSNATVPSTKWLFKDKVLHWIPSKGGDQRIIFLFFTWMASLSQLACFYRMVHSLPHKVGTVLFIWVSLFQFQSDEAGSTSRCIKLESNPGHLVQT